ncbi:MAG: hypothetical protein NTW14_10450 [bacterium]|nr:hypothetical protein [bacterium]
MRRYHPFWFSFYNFVIIPALFLGAQIARFFNSKVNEGIKGRRGLFRRLKEIKAGIPATRKIVVIHCASAGEFEAARPILSAIRRVLPNLHIHVTCYSPSGLRPIAKAENLDSFSYLPFDSYYSSSRFLRTLKPAAFIFIKHDVWPNMVWGACRRHIPCLWVNANLHEGTKRLGLFSKGLNRSFMGQLSAILTVDDSHAIRLAQLASPDKIVVAGDSRYDRTVDRMKQLGADEAKILPTEWFKGKKVIVAGSTWGPDQRILIPAFARLKKEFPELYLVLVPHEPHDDFLADTELYLKGFELLSVRLSQLNGELPRTDALIVDRVGILAMLYRTAWAAYVGGAFGEGVHSVLEPAVYGLPLFFGPKYYMSHEAQALAQRGGALPVHSSNEVEEKIRLFLKDPATRQRAANESRLLVEKGCGATERIVTTLERLMTRVN